MSHAHFLTFDSKCTYLCRVIQDFFVRGGGGGTSLKCSHIGGRQACLTEIMASEIPMLVLTN